METYCVNYFLLFNAELSLNRSIQWPALGLGQGCRKTVQTMAIETPTHHQKETKGLLRIKYRTDNYATVCTFSNMINITSGAFGKRSHYEWALWMQHLFKFSVTENIDITGKTVFYVSVTLKKVNFIWHSEFQSAVYQAWILCVSCNKRE